MPRLPGRLMVRASLLSMTAFAAGTLVSLAVTVFPPLIPANCPQFPALNGPGVLCEDFDTNRNGFGRIDFTRLPIGVDPNDPLRALGDPNDDVLGYTQGTGAAPTGTGGRRCSDDRGLGRLGCDAPVPEENDWHLHSTFEGPDPSYDSRAGHTAPDGGKARSGLRSMHWGRHVESSTAFYDSLRYRQVAAFVLDPAVNIGPASQLDFWHILSIPDDENAGAGFLPPGGTFGGAQVQISLLGANGKFEKWRRLLPSFNGYDSIVNTTISICQFDAGDDQLPPNDDSFCGTASQVWSDLGSVLGIDATCTVDTTGDDPEHRDCGAISSCTGGPGCTERGNLGDGVWARSAFDLSPFAGRTARLRWIGALGGGWSFGVSRSFVEPGGDEVYGDLDDGWFLDDIRLTDLRQAPLACSDDADSDGVASCTDCNDIDAAAQAEPSEVQDVTFAANGTLSWTPPANPGGSVIVYDTIASDRSTFFVDGGRCVEADDGHDLSAVDAAVPPPSKIFYYLVRAQNGCPGGAGPAGIWTSGYGRVTRTCP